MIPHTILALLLTLLLTFQTTGQVVAKNKISIWEIRDHDNVVFLAGSVHLLKESDLPIPEGYFRVYEASEHVHFELDMALIKEDHMKAQMLELGKLPPHDKLSSHLSQKTMERLKEYFSAKRIPLQAINQLKPGMLIMTLGALAAQEEGARPENGVEALIFERCLVDSKSNSGLETAEFQLSMFDVLSSEILDELINDALDELKTDREKSESLLKAWKNGEVETLDKLIMDDDSPRGELVHEIVLAKRNRNWLQNIEAAIKGKRNELFVVGAGHLVGKDGLVKLLEDKGYTLHQLTTDSLINFSRNPQAITKK